MKSKTIVEIIAALFIVFFVHSAILSFLRIQSLKNLLAFYTYSKTEVAWAIIIIEVATALLLIFPRTRTLGLIMSLLFMIGLGITIWLTLYHPHDFEGVLNNMTNKQRWWLIIVSVILATIAIPLKWKASQKIDQKENIPIVYT